MKAALVLPCLLSLAACSPGGSSGAASDAGAAITCTASLASACDADAATDFGVELSCPPGQASALPGPWCAENPRAGRLYGACGGYLPLPLGVGTDELYVFMYDAASGALVAVLDSVDLGAPSCVGGAPTFRIPVSCFSDDGQDLFNAFTGPGGSATCEGFDAGPSVTDAGDASD